MAGTSNFQIWNPSSINQENDSQYTADTLRSGGATTGALLPSKTDNKFRYQTSVGIWALMQMMAAKGFNVSDASASSLASVLANILTTADQRTQLLSPAWSPTLVLDCSKADGFELSVTGNTAVSAINATAGQVVRVAVVQPVGGHTVTLGSGFHGAGAPSTAVGSVSVQTFLCLVGGGLYATSPMIVSS